MRPPAPAAGKRPSRRVIPAPAPAPSGAMRLVTFKQCQDCIRHELDGRLKRLFQELTGLPLGVMWHCLPRFGLGARRPPCARVRGPGDGTGGLAPECERCRRQHWDELDSSTRREHRFQGACGLENHWVRVQGRGLCPARLLIQARLRAPASSPASAGEPGKQVNGADFERASALLRFACRELELALEADGLRQALLDHDRLRRALEAEDRRWRRAVHARLSSVPVTPPTPNPGTRAQQLVQQMAEYVRQHLRRPLSLRALAGALGMNASYLSTVFSRTTGVPFHRYLDEVRLSEACALLEDPRNRVAEVASRVGYASEDWFRHAFKHHTGLAPSAWRSARRGPGEANPKEPPLFR